MESRPLVAIDEWMIFRRAKSVGGCEFGQIRFRGIERFVLRTSEGGVQQTFVADPWGTSKRCQRCRMEREERPAINPVGLFHFANARKGPEAVGLFELTSLFDEMEHVLLMYSGGPAKEEILRQIVGVQELETLRFVLIIQALKANYPT